MPDVALAETRVQSSARIYVDGFYAPIQALLLSLPEQREPLLNQLYLLSGRHALALDEVVIARPFAEAHELSLNDELEIVLNGTRSSYRVVGIALSPEFIYQLGPADIMPDYERYGVFWLSEDALAGPLNMLGAFNHVSLRLQQQADIETLILQLDTLLESYGGRGAYRRDDQASHSFINEELNQLRINSIFLPTLFLGSAAFLLYIFTQRQIHTQRQTIAIMKAFGYYQWQVMVHYLSFTGLIVMVGVFLGSLLGYWLADRMVQLYSYYFSFVSLKAKIQPSTLAIAFLVTLSAGLLGTAYGVYNAVKIPPAQAMRPPNPTAFHSSRFSRLLSISWLSQGARIILRNLSRYPLRTFSSISGVALSGGLLMFGSYQFSAINEILNRNYQIENQMDLVIHFAQITDADGLHSLAALPGVGYLEGVRSVPIRLHHGRRVESTVLTGFSPNSELRNLAGLERLPDHGLVITDHLARKLGIEPGMTIETEVIAERRITFDLPVVAVSAEAIGIGAYMALPALNEMLLEGGTLTGAWLLIDDEQQTELYNALNDMPRIAGYTHLREAERKLSAYIDATVLAAMGIIFLLAGSMTFAMVYNNARIALAERERELATLRVLGYSHGEIARILFGELIIVVVVAIPVGWLLGSLFAVAMSAMMSSEMFRIPFIVNRQVFALSALGVLLATAFAILLMIRKLRKIDLIAALKSE
ncbi:ABC transporter permease [Pseudidiomarina halophila]|uniref:ABC transporter permease n=1 Tax=Pseudidiomarina halophila TaxID=1449799 RepID=UPI00361DDB79